MEVEEGLALVALIGNDLSKACGVGKEVFGVLEPFNIRMICYGASSHNLCLSLIHISFGDLQRAAFIPSQILPDARFH